MGSLTLCMPCIFSVFSSGQETRQYFPTYLFEYNKITYHLKAYKVVFLSFWKTIFWLLAKFKMAPIMMSSRVFNNNFKQKLSWERESWEWKVLQKAKSFLHVLYIYWKFRGGYCDSFQNGGLFSYGSEKPVFFKK